MEKFLLKVINRPEITELVYCAVIFLLLVIVIIALKTLIFLAQEDIFIGEIQLGWPTYIKLVGK